MKAFLLIPLTLILSLSVLSQDYKKIHSDAVVIDTHNDIISTCIESGHSFDQDLKGKTHSDLNRMFEGGLDVQMFSVYCDGKQKNPFAFANREIDTLYAWIKRNPSKMMLVTNPAELQQAVKQKKLASMIGVEGGHMIENNLDKLQKLYDRGARYITLTWNNNNDWATSAEYESGSQRKNGQIDTTSQKKGLSDFGRQVVKKMNDLGMMVDVSHVGEQTFWDVIELSNKPIIASHSNAYTLCPVYRNLKDDQIKAIAKNGGVIHLNFYAAFLDSTVGPRQSEFVRKHRAERDSLVKAGHRENAMDMIREKYKEEYGSLQASFNSVFDHMEHIIQLAGIDHVGLGGDFDGITLTPAQLTDVTKYPLITKELVDRGYSKKDINKILGGNFIRVFEANQKK